MTDKENQPNSFYKKVSLYGKGQAPELDAAEAKLKKRIFIALLLSLGIL